MLDHVSVGETWASFSKKVSENGPAKQPLEDAWNDFGEWLNAGKHVQAMPFLKTFRAVLSYEMNRPYEYWYGRRDTIELDAGIEKTIADIAGKIETEEPSSDFVNKAREYLAKAKS
jgi:phage tail tape-measure protein